MSQTRQILSWLSVLGVLSLIAVGLQRQQRLDESIVAGAKIASATDEETVENYRLLYLEWGKQRALAELAEKRAGATPEGELARLRQYLVWNYGRAAFSRLSPKNQSLVTKLPDLPDLQPTPSNRRKIAALGKEYRESLQARGIKFLID